MPYSATLPDGTQLKLRNYDDGDYEYPDGTTKQVPSTIISLIYSVIGYWLGSKGIMDYEPKNEIMTISFDYPYFYFVERSRLFLNLIELNCETGEYTTKKNQLPTRSVKAINCTRDLFCCSLNLLIK